jgi:hypothetical protein
MQTREHAYNTAAQQLNTILNQIQADQRKQDLRRTGIKVRDLLQTYRAAQMSDEDLNRMTKWVEGINAVLLNPLDDIALSNHIENTQAALTYGNKNKWLNVFTGLMLALLGLALLALSITAIALIAAGTLPIDGPIGIAGMVVGFISLGIITGGESFKDGLLPPSVYAHFGFGVTAVAGGITAVCGTLFAIHSYKGNVKITGDNIEEAAHTFRAG